MAAPWRTLPFKADEFRERLKEACVSSGDSYRELARKAGITGQTMYNYIHGNTLPDAEVLFKLCYLTGTDANYMLTGKKKKRW